MTARAAAVAPPRALPTALVCAGCGHRVPDDAPLALRLPGRPTGRRRRPRPRPAASIRPRPSVPADAAAPNPFVRWRTRFHAYHRARALGWSDARYHRVRRPPQCAGSPSSTTHRSSSRRSPGPTRSRDALGFSAAGGVWVKDETGNVSGSHKARHLMGTLVELGGRGGAAGARRRTTSAPAPRDRLVRQRRPRRGRRRARGRPPPRRLHPDRRRPGRRGAAPRRSARTSPSASASRASPATRRTTPSCGPSTPARSPSPARATSTASPSRAALTLGWEMAEAIGSPGGPAPPRPGRRPGRRRRAPVVRGRRPGRGAGGNGARRAAPPRPRRPARDRSPARARLRARPRPRGRAASRSPTHWPTPRATARRSCGRGRPSRTASPMGSSTTRRTTGGPAWRR